MRAHKPSKPSSAKSPSMSGEETLEVFELLKGATSVELKLMVPDASRRAAVKRLGFDPVDAEPRQAYFFDTPDLALNKAGVVVRARRRQGGRGDTVVKLRPVVPATLDPELRKAAGFKIELDAMPGGYVCSASYKGACTSQEVFDVTEGEAPLESLFSKEQRAFYAANAPKEIPMNALVPLGPTFLLRFKHQPKRFDRRLTIELWLYPDGSRIFEISTKCGTEEAFQTGVEFRALMAKCGIPLVESKETKTNSALAFFRKDLISQQAE
jgi:hypothetical protein